MPNRSRAPLYRRADSPYWWTYIYADGRRYRVSTKCTDKAAASIEAVRLQRESVDPRPRSFTVNQTLAAYIVERTDWAERTALRHGYSAAALDRVLGTHLTRQLTRTDLESYRATRPARSCEKELSFLFAALKAARRRGEVVPDLEQLRLPRLRRDTEQRMRWLTKTEVEQLTAHLRSHRSEWVWLACYTGLRRSELNALAWAHVDLDNALLRVPGTKSKRSRRVIPLSQTILPMLRRRKAEGLPPVRIWKSPYETLCNAASAAAIERVIPHDFRRTFASWLLQSGVGHHAIADLLGHEGMQLVRSVYAHLGASDLRAAINLLL